MAYPRASQDYGALVDVGWQRVTPFLNVLMRVHSRHSVRRSGSLVAPQRTQTPFSIRARR
jgi:hypothetical protein